MKLFFIEEKERSLEIYTLEGTFLRSDNFLSFEVGKVVWIRIDYDSQKSGKANKNFMKEYEYKARFKFPKKESF